MPIVDDYFKIGYNLSPEQILSDAKSRILKGAASDNRDFTALKNYLNSLYYGKEGSSIMSRLQDIMIKYYEEKFQTQFDNFDFERFLLSNSGAEEGKISLNERTQFSHSEKIAWNTIWKRLLEAKYQLEQLNTIKNPNKAIQETMSNLQQLVETADHLLADFPYSLSQQGLKVFKVTNNTKDIIAKIDELYQNVTFAASFPLSNQDMGELFEKILTVLGNGIDVNSLTDKQLYDLFHGITKGQMPVIRGGEIQLTGIEFTPKEERTYNPKTGQMDKRTMKYEITGENGSKITVGGEFSEKLGKMDVEFIMPDSQERFRVSAKNWKMLENRDFGTTNLEAALMRTGGFINTVGYGVTVGFGNSPLQNAHDYAKACVFLDIVMGYSQETGYADTIIINNRQTPEILVYSVQDLLNKYNYDAIIGYSEDAIRNGIRSRLNTDQHLSEQAYENKILSALKTFKLSVSSSVLK